METQVYKKEYEELRDILVNQLPKYGCDPPNIDRWNRVRLSLSDAERRQQQIRELTENDPNDMLAMGQKLTNEIRTVKAENAGWGLALGKKLDELYEKVEKLIVASQGGNDLENHLGPSVGQLISEIAGINGLKKPLFQLLSGLHDEKRLTTFRDQLKEHVDHSLAMQTQDIKKEIKESTEPIANQLKEVTQILHSFSQASNGKEAVKEKEKETGDADLVDVSHASNGQEAVKEQKNRNGDADLDDDLSTINLELLNIDAADQELQQEIAEPVGH
jgi:vacuolar-type H+-ATPase subunit F/Vma7